jgi:hypothetical protein
LRSPSPRKLLDFVRDRCRLRRYLARPGDGRPKPQIPARDLIWALLICQVLREASLHAVEGMVRSAGRHALGVTRSFGDDAPGYFLERLDPQPTRDALAQVAKGAKRNKAFQDCRLIGLALDGTGAGRCSEHKCKLCHQVHDAGQGVLCYLHHFCMASVVGPPGLALPIDVEPYGPGDCEYSAGQRLLARAVASLGPRYADFVVVDGEFATAPFVHAAGDLSLRVVARLKENLPGLSAAVRARFEGTRAHRVVTIDGDRVELWDADDFDPWETLRWTTVRVLRYRQHKPDGTVVEADWLTDFPTQQIGAVPLYGFAKSRWRSIENQGFNVGKTFHGMEHIPHHHENALLCWWLLIALALTLERLYRLRYLRRGTHPPLTAVALVRLLRLALAARSRRDTS